MAGKNVLNYLVCLSSTMAVMDHFLIEEDENLKFLCEDIRDIAKKSLEKEFKNIDDKSFSRIYKFTSLLRENNLDLLISKQIYLNWILGLVSDRLEEISKASPEHERVYALTEIEDLLFTLNENIETVYEDDFIAGEFLKRYDELFEREF